MLKLFNPGYTQLTFFILFPKNCLFFSLPLFTHSTVQQKWWTQKEQLCNCLLFKKNYWCLMQNTFVWLYAMHFWGFACASATFYTLFVDEKAETGGSKFDILKWREKCQNVSNTFYEAVGTLSTKVHLGFPFVHQYHWRWGFSQAAICAEYRVIATVYKCLTKHLCNVIYSVNPWYL